MKVPGTFSAFAVLAACTSRAAPVDFDYTDRYTGMQEICRWDLYRAEYAAFGDRIEGPTDFDIPAYPSAACVDRVVEDLHVDLDAFLAFDGLESAYEIALEGGPVWHEAVLGSPLSAARAIGLLETGPIEDDRGKTFVSDDFVDVLHAVADESGSGTAAGAMYNFVAATVVTLIPAPKDGRASASFAPSDGTVTWYEPTGADADNLGLLLHEARHALGDPGHTDCAANAGIPGAEDACDVAYDGAFAFGIAALAIAQRGHTDPWLRGILRSDAEAQLRMVNGCLDEEGLGAEWEEQLDRVFWTD